MQTQGSSLMERYCEAELPVVSERSTEKIARVLIVDDHPAMLEGLSRVLSVSNELQVIGKARSGEEAIILFAKLMPDIVLLDIHMPGMSGIDTVRELRLRYPDIKIVILTAYADERYVLEAIQSGAFGYLLKDMDAEDLRRAVWDAFHGRPPLSPMVTRPLLAQFADMRRNQSHRPGGLSDRHMDMLRLLATGASNKDMAQKLYLSPATIKREMNRLFNTLDVNDRARAVALAYEKGYI